MKKTYIIPAQLIVQIDVKHHLMDLSAGNSASISSQEADGDAFVKEYTPSDNSIWDNEW